MTLVLGKGDMTLVYKIASSFLMIIVISTFGCGSIEEDKIKKLRNGKIVVIGHAGSAFLYPVLPFNPFPPNSKKSIRKALFENMADGVEVDIQMSSDTVLILFHDSDLSVLNKSNDCVSNTKAEELLGEKFNTGIIYGLFHDETVISFEELLSWFNTFDQYPELHLDVKNFDNCLQGNQEERAELLALKIHEIVRKYNIPLQKLVIGSSDKKILKMLKHLDNDYSLMLDENIDFDKAMEWTLQNQMQGLIIGSGIADKDKIEMAHQHGLLVVIFGGRSKRSIIEIINKNPDAIQVNNVGQLKRLLQ